MLFKVVQVTPLYHGAAVALQLQGCAEIDKAMVENPDLAGAPQNSHMQLVLKAEHGKKYALDQVYDFAHGKLLKK